MRLKYEKYPYIVLRDAGKCKNYITIHGQYSPEICEGQHCIPFGDDSPRIDHEETLKLKPKTLVIEENQIKMSLEQYVGRFHPYIIEAYEKWCEIDRTNKMELNKENILDYYEMKKASIEEMRDKAKSKDEIQGWTNQLNLIEALILELDLFD